MKKENEIMGYSILDALHTLNTLNESEYKKMMTQNTIRDSYRNLKFEKPFIASHDGEPAPWTHGEFSRDKGWVVADPQKCIEYLDSISIPDIHIYKYRDGGTLHFVTPDLEIAFIYAKPGPIYYPFAVKRKIK